MSNVRVTNGVPDFLAALNAALPKAVANAAEVYVSSASTSMQRTGGKGVGRGVAYNNPSRPGEPPAVQTGALRRSIVRTNPVNLTAKVGSALSYGKYLEFGANPHGKGKKLAVPLNNKARRLAAGVSSLKQLDLDVLPRKGRNTLLGKSTKGGGFEPLFVLVDSVTIAPRPWLRPAMRNRDNARKAELVIARTLKNEIMRTARGGA